jgi:AcrR family transcriptional regulator
MSDILSEEKKEKLRSSHKSMGILTRLPESTWLLAKQRYARDPTIRYVDLAKELGISTQTVYRYAKKHEWRKARAGALGGMSSAISRAAGRSIAKSEDFVAQEAEQVVESLQGLDDLIRHVLLCLGHAEPRDDDERAIVLGAPQRWENMTARELAPILKQAVEAYRDLSVHRRLLEG